MTPTLALTASIRRAIRSPRFARTFTCSAADAVGAPLARNAGVDRLQSTADAKAFLKRNYEPDGDLHIPVITMHDQRDPLVPFFHEQRLHDAVAAAGQLDMLRQYNFASFGHASSTVQGQIPAKFLELVAWANSLSPTP